MLDKAGIGIEKAVHSASQQQPRGKRQRVGKMVITVATTVAAMTVAAMIVVAPKVTLTKTVATTMVAATMVATTMVALQRW